MATTDIPARNTYLGARAELLKTRWEHRLGRQLGAQTQRLMPGRNGANYNADIVLQAPGEGWPVVVFEVIEPGRSARQVTQNLRRLLDTQSIYELLGQHRPIVVIVASSSEEAERVREEAGTTDVQVEVI